MHTEYLVIDHYTEGEEVEHVCEVVPDIGISVLASALGVETVRLRDTARLMVTTDQMDTLRVTQLQAHEKGDGLHTEEATIDVVACRQWLAMKYTRGFHFRCSLT